MSQPGIPASALDEEELVDYVVALKEVAPGVVNIVKTPKSALAAPIALPQSWADIADNGFPALQAAVAELQALVAESVHFLADVRVATTGGGTLVTDFENGDTVDGVVLATNDRILLKDQAAPSENGIYTVNASGAPTRATDADTSDELLGAAVYVRAGTTNAARKYAVTNSAAITVDTTDIEIALIGESTSGTFQSYPSGALPPATDSTDRGIVLVDGSARVPLISNGEAWRAYAGSVPTPSWIADADAFLDLDFAGNRYFNDGEYRTIDEILDVSRTGAGANVVDLAGNVTPVAANLARRSDQGLLVEQFASNYFPFSLSPSTRTITITNGSLYTVSCGIGGSVTLSGAASGTVNAGSPITFSASGTSLTLTKIGSPAFVQCENSTAAFATSPIKSSSVTTTRGSEVVSIDLAAMPWFDQLPAATIAVWFKTSQNIQSGTFWQLDNGTNAERLVGNWKVTPTHQAGITVTSGGVDLIGLDPTLPYEVTLGAEQCLAATWDTLGNGLAIAMDGSPVNSFAQSSWPNMAAMTKLRFGALVGGSYLNGHIQRIAILPGYRPTEVDELSALAA